MLLGMPANRYCLKSDCKSRQCFSAAVGVVVVVLLIAAFVVEQSNAFAAGPRKEAPATCSRYSLPKSVVETSYQFAGENVPIQRPDVRSRILFQVNFLLMDARSVLTDWLSEKTRYVWLLEELIAKEGVPKDFVWLAPILAGTNLKSQGRQAGAGWWALENNCDSTDGMEMADDSWHDDRLDLELATRCFATRIKQIRKNLGDVNWLMAASAYISGESTVQDSMKRWNSKAFWDIPLPETTEELVVRWIALKIISGHREHFGLKFKESAPLAFDQVSGITLSKDLQVADVGHMVGIASRQVLELNPKIKTTSGVFPSQFKGKTLIHSIAVPKGKGSILLEKLKSGGYVSEQPKS
jgi:membrane-bound lytic murein transglycosylase D